MKRGIIRQDGHAPGRFWYRLRLVVLLVVVAIDAIAIASYISDRRFFRSLASEIINNEPLSEREQFERFVHFAFTELKHPTLEQLPTRWAKLYYRFNPFHPSARDVLKYGCDYRGGCGSSSRVVLALLQETGIPGRVLILRDRNDRSLHAVVNASIDGRWAVADPLFGLVFVKADGKLATAEELGSDRSLFHMNVERNPAYPVNVFTYDNFTLMNWEKVPVVLPTVRKLLDATIGEERTRSIARPRLWMYPPAAFAFFFTSFALAFVGVVELTRAVTRARRRL